jgi:hypothetical protein
LKDISEIFPEGETSILAIDLETTGTDPTEPDFAIVGIGLADKTGCYYIPYDVLDQESLDYLAAHVQSRPCTSFNVLFDGMVLLACGWGWLNWAMCSFGLFRQLATEGYDGQRWNLETLCRDVLGWPSAENNKAHLASLLGKHGLKKEEMWKLAELEPQAFGEYCAIDAEAHYQAFFALADATYDLPDEVGATLRSYHKNEFLNEVWLLARQQLRGLVINEPKLRKYRGETTDQIEDGLQAFYKNDEVAPALLDFNEQIVAEHRAHEPAATRKDGQPSVLWERWRDKLHIIKTQMHFNAGSGQQLAWLFFEKLGKTPAKYTDGGAPSVDKSVLPTLGAAGKILAGVKKKQKEMTYVDAVLLKQRNGVLHAAMKSVGTVTGRLSGGEEAA